MRGFVGSNRVPADHVTDTVAARQVLHRENPFTGKFLSMRTDTVDLGPEAGHEQVVRDYIRHPGAVAIIALDDAEQVLLVQQYRHPLGALLWEPPAGLLDVPGESLLAAAQRELFEEAGMRAATWHVLADYFNSPGGSDEKVRVFLARDLSEVPESQRHVGEAEERDMPTCWLPLDVAVTKVLAGELANPHAVIGFLAAAHARRAGWLGLREADAEWLRPRQR